MILDPKIKIVEVSLQGVLHAVVPVTSNNQVIAYKNAPEKRLNRALRQIEREYGLKLTFTPDKPRREYNKIKSVMIEVDEVIEEYKKSSDLPKCKASDHTKEIYLGYLREKEPDNIQNGNADLWFSLSEIRIDPVDHLYGINCPFCERTLSYSDWYVHRNIKDQIGNYKKTLLQCTDEGRTLCESCHISFKWDFDKNIVVMRNEQTE